jgi:hypothetical protein
MNSTGLSESDLAIWRYGKRLVRRRRGYWMSTMLMLLAAGLSGALAWRAQNAAVTVFTGLGWLFAWAMRNAFVTDGTTARLDRALRVIGGEAETAFADWHGSFGGAWLRPDGELMVAAVRIGDRTPEGSYPVRGIELRGASAAHALAVILSAHNLAGASDGAIRDAVKMMEDEGGASALLARTEAIARSRGMGHRRVTSLPADLRLAVEIAANIEVERHVLNGDAAELTQRWRDADAIGSITDSV